MSITLNGTSGILTPSVTPTSSNRPQNGQYLPSANTLGFATSNTDRLLIDNLGNLVLGSATAYGQITSHTTQGGSSIGVVHGTGGSYPKVSGISFGATSTSLTVNNNGSTTIFTGGAGIYANNSAASNNPTDLVFWTTSGGNPVEKARINSSGIVTTPYQPSFRAYSNAGGYSTVGVVPFNQTSLNVGNHYNTSNYTFTAPVSGSYFFAWSASTTSSSTNSLDLQINGSTVSYNETQTTMAYFVRGQSQIFYLSAGDTAKIVLRFGTANLGDPSTNFQGFLIG